MDPRVVICCQHCSSTCVERICPICSLAMYCSSQCEAADRERHSAFCRAVTPEVRQEVNLHVRALIENPIFFKILCILARSWMRAPSHWRACIQCNVKRAIRLRAKGFYGCTISCRRAAARADDDILARIKVEIDGHPTRADRICMHFIMPLGSQTQPSAYADAPEITSLDFPDLDDEDVVSIVMDSKGSCVCQLTRDEAQCVSSLHLPPSTNVNLSSL